MLIPYAFTVGHKNYAVNFAVSYGPFKGHLYPDIAAMLVCTHEAVDGAAPQPRNQDDISETFWHEATHAILHDMGHPLWRDEKFVSDFSKRLNQLVLTAKL
jgi:hypothetical protein